ARHRHLPSRVSAAQSRRQGEGVAGPVPRPRHLAQGKRRKGRGEMTEQAGSTASFEAPSSARLDALCDAAVRDIAWLLFSPALLRAQPPRGVLATPFESPDEAAAAMDWLEEQDADPAPLHRHLATLRMTRLGRYAECLLAWFLKHGPAARLI